jgi:hypothetical protein
MEDAQDLEDMTLEDIEEILERFVQLGLAEAVICEDGEVGYQITEMGAALYESQSQKRLN